MLIDFDNKDIVFLYGYFTQEMDKLVALKNTPGCPIAPSSIDDTIDTYKSIIEKLTSAVPEVKKILGN